MSEFKNDQAEFFDTVNQLRLLQKSLEKQLSNLKRYLSILETDTESEENRLLCADLIKKTEECLKSIRLLRELDDGLTLLKKNESLIESGSSLFNSQHNNEGLRVCPRCGQVLRDNSLFCAYCGSRIEDYFMGPDQQSDEGEFEHSGFSSWDPPVKESDTDGSWEDGNSGKASMAPGSGSGGFGVSGDSAGGPSDGGFGVPGDSAWGPSDGGFGGNGYSGQGSTAPGSWSGGFGMSSPQPQAPPPELSSSGGEAYNSPGHSSFPMNAQDKPSAGNTTNPLLVVGSILAAPFIAAGSLFKWGRDKKEIGQKEIQADRAKEELTGTGIVQNETTKEQNTGKDVIQTDRKEEEETSRNANNEITISNVEFSAKKKKKMHRGEYSIIHLVMYEEEYRSVAERILSQSAGENVETPGGALDISHHSKIRISLSAPDLKTEDGVLTVEEERIWQGKYQNFSFEVYIPAEYDKRQVLFKVKVYIDDVIASVLSFTAHVDADREQKLSILRKDILSAFVSYAREDCERVLSIVQGMRTVRRDLDIFMDVKDLRSGDEWEKILQKEIGDRDIFYLCWSIAASKSKNVEKEWRYALKHKGFDCIEPVPIDSPELCPPPEELKSKHFNDNLLYMIDAYRRNRRIQE